MRINNKRILSFSMAALIALGVLAGCSDEDAVTPTQTGTTTPATSEHSTVPTKDPEQEGPVLHVTHPLEGNTEDVAQLRLHNVKSGWMNAFETESGMFLLADSVQSLLDGLSRRGIDTAQLNLQAYDDAFFAENRLVVIPRNSNSGSVRYTARVEKTTNGVRISTVGKMPEVGTADMADWLVLVPLSNAEYSGNVKVENVKSIASNSQRYAVHRF